MRKPFLQAALLLSVLSYFPAFSQTHYDRAQLSVYFQNQEFGKAVSYLLEKQVSSTELSAYQADLGYAYFMNEQLELAEKQFAALYALHPNHIQANLYLAQIHELRDRVDSSLYYYRNLVQLQPDNFRFWQKAGQHFNQLNNYDSAFIYLEKAYSLNPTSGKLMVQYINQLIRQKKTGRVDSLLNQFLARDSANVDVLVKKIDVCYKKPVYEEVIFWGERLLRDSVDVNAPYVNLAYSYLNQDSIDKCIWLCEWMIAGNKGSQPLLYCAALAYARKKKYEQSNALLDACIALSIQKDAATYFNAKADNYEELKQYKKTVSYYDTSYYLFRLPADLYLTGRIYDKYYNNKAKARLYYQRFLDKQKNPRNSGEIKIIEYIREYVKPDQK